MEIIRTSTPGWAERAIAELEKGSNIDILQDTEDSSLIGAAQEQLSRHEISQHVRLDLFSKLSPTVQKVLSFNVTILCKSSSEATSIDIPATVLKTSALLSKTFDQLFKKELLPELLLPTGVEKETFQLYLNALNGDLEVLKIDGCKLVEVIELCNYLGDISLQSKLRGLVWENIPKESITLEEALEAIKFATSPFNDMPTIRYIIKLAESQSDPISYLAILNAISTCGWSPEDKRLVLSKLAPDYLEKIIEISDPAQFAQKLIEIKDIISDIPLDMKISNSLGFSDTHFSILVSQLPQIVTIKLSNLPSITTIPPGLATLSSCSIYQCEKLMEITALGEAPLKSLILNYLPITAISIPLPLLENCEIADCDYLKDLGSLSHCRLLKVLKLKRVNCAVFPSELISLSRLDLSNCHRFSNIDLRGSPTISRLTIDSCEGLEVISGVNEETCQIVPVTRPRFRIVK